MNRIFILDAIERAIESINDDDEIELDVCLDRDTNDVPGSPDIVNTIFDKIEVAHIFIADVSIINSNSVGRKTINPNVAIELGYAAAKLSWENVVCIFNRKYGDIEELPFDIRQRRIASFELAPGDERRRERKNIIHAIREQILHTINKGSMSRNEARVGVVDVESNETYIDDWIYCGDCIRPMNVEDFRDRASLSDFGINEYNFNNMFSGINAVSLLKDDWKSCVNRILSNKNKIREGNIVVVDSEGSHESEGYFSEVSNYISICSFLKEYKITIENTGKSTLRNVMLAIEVDESEGAFFYDVGSVPKKPKINSMLTLSCSLTLVV